MSESDLQREILQVTAEIEAVQAEVQNLSQTHASFEKERDYLRQKEHFLRQKELLLRDERRLGMELLMLKTRGAVAGLSAGGAVAPADLARKDQNEGKRLLAEFNHWVMGGKEKTL